jgi:hypothetical protein
MEDPRNVRRHGRWALARRFGVGAVAGVCIFSPSVTRAESSQPNSFPEIHGQAVDKTTQGRIPGVFIVGFWAGPDATPLQYSQTLRVVETSSDADGRFMVPASERMDPEVPVGRSSPGLLCFKPGYEPVWLGGGGTVLVGQPVKVRLHKSDRAPGAQSEMVSGLLASLAWLAASRDGQPPSAIFAAVEAEWIRLQGELALSEREGTTPRARFAWLVEEFRRANRERVKP